MRTQKALDGFSQGRLVPQAKKPFSGIFPGFPCFLFTSLASLIKNGVWWVKLETVTPDQVAVMQHLAEARIRRALDPLSNRSQVHGLFDDI
jgi:hypothetical protein